MAAVTTLPAAFVANTVLTAAQQNKVLEKNPRAGATNQLFNAADAIIKGTR